jgi:predicted outer membrane repeat protein
MSASKPVSGPGSLRDAIGTAAPGDTIAFNLPNPSVITLSSTLTINSNLSIQGPGATQLAVSGNNVVANVFSINVGVTVNVSGLTIEKGNANAIRGGGINNLGTLTVTNCTLSDNSATFGGGIENAHGATLIVTNSTFSGNSAINGSGGGRINNLGTLTVTNCTFSDNSAGFGGGIEAPPLPRSR